MAAAAAAAVLQIRQAERAAGLGFRAQEGLVRREAPQALLEQTMELAEVALVACPFKAAVHLEEEAKLV